MPVSERFSPQSFEIVKKSITILLLDIYTDVNGIMRRSGIERVYGIRSQKNTKKFALVQKRTLILTLTKFHQFLLIDYGLLATAQVEFKHYINICFECCRWHISLFAIRDQFRVFAILV